MTDGYKQKVLISLEDLQEIQQFMREISQHLADVRMHLATLHEAKPAPLPPLDIPTPGGKR